jgi:hypothetical protein
MPKRRWNDNIKIDFGEVDGSMEWIDLTQDKGQMAGYIFIK